MQLGITRFIISCYARSLNHVFAVRQRVRVLNRRRSIIIVRANSTTTKTRLRINLGAYGRHSFTGPSDTVR